jgi:hypothetical protein
MYVLLFSLAGKGLKKIRTFSFRQRSCGFKGVQQAILFNKVVRDK